MKIPFAPNAAAIMIAIGLILVSTATLTLLSYYYTFSRENLAETTLVQSNIKLASQYVDRIEQKIIDNDRILSDMIDVNQPNGWPAMVEAIRKADLNVDQVYFLRPGNSYPLYPPYSYEIRNLWGAFRASFNISELNLDRLAVSAHHLHKGGPATAFCSLCSRKLSEKILVCYQMDLTKSSPCSTGI
jgi:hypothetical protein